MRTSAIIIAQTTKYISPSINIGFNGVLKNNGSIFNFPNPSLVFRKEDISQEEERVYTLFSQLFNYDINNKNQYFIKLEMDLLFQEIKMAINSIIGEKKEYFNKIYREVIEINKKYGFIQNIGHFNKDIENFKNETNIITQKFKSQKNEFNTSKNKNFKNSNSIYKNSHYNVGLIKNISVLENSLIKPFNYELRVINKEQWQKQIYEFYNIYKSMNDFEKQEFLNAISLSENDIVSVRKMTKEQWGIFIKNILPKVSSFVNSYNENIKLENSIYNNELLNNISKLTEKQWLDFKMILLNSHNNDFKNLSSFFELRTNQNNSDIHLWQKEKQDFINYVYENKYIKLLKYAFDVIEYDVNNKLQYSENLVNNVTEKFTEWITYLTETQWEDVKTVINNSKNEYIKPFLENIKNENTQGVEPKFSAEKRGAIEYINNNRKYIFDILSVLKEKEEVKKEIGNWIDLEILNKKEINNNDYIKPFLKILNISKIEKGMSLFVNDNYKNLILKNIINKTDFVNLKNNHKEFSIIKNIQSKNIDTNSEKYLHKTANKEYENSMVFSNSINEFDDYKTANLVIAKNNNKQSVVSNTPKIPDVVSEVKKTIKNEIDDVIMIKDNIKQQETSNKTIYELVKRLDTQQNEIDNIIKSQKQMLKITDISFVTEKVINHMQSQLKLEKMRRGL